MIFFVLEGYLNFNNCFHHQDEFSLSPPSVKCLHPCFRVYSPIGACAHINSYSMYCILTWLDLRLSNRFLQMTSSNSLKPNISTDIQPYTHRFVSTHFLFETRNNLVIPQFLNHIKMQLTFHTTSHPRIFPLAHCLTFSNPLDQCFSKYRKVFIVKRIYKFSPVINNLSQILP